MTELPPSPAAAMAAENLLQSGSESRINIIRREK